MLKRLFVAVTLACLVAGAVRAEILEQILVKVNGDIITKTELEQRQLAVLRQRQQLASNPDTEELKRAIAEITPQVIVDAVDELLLVQRGRELGYKLGDEQFKGVIENIKKENRMESEEQFQAALKQEGLTMADLRKSIERQMMISRVQQTDVLGKVGVSDEEAERHYKEHPDEFTSQPSITLREILVTVPGDGKTLNVGVDEEAQAKAEAARARILAGEPFDKVAADVSDAPSKANGGLVGPINKGELAPALVDALVSVKVGNISPVLRTQRGYQILKLESMTDSTVLPYDQVKEQIGDKIFDRKRRGELETYLKKLRAQAIIEWKNDEIRKAYAQRIAALSSPSPSLP
jgi:peptidyl-prolyl cis-trans isomerase SurA